MPIQQLANDGYRAIRSKAAAIYFTYRRLRMRRMAPVPIREVWTASIPEELHFWESFLTTGLEWKEELANRLDPLAPIADALIIEHLAQLPNRRVSVVDVGAGPLSSVGRTYPGKTVTVTPVDPLAAEYDKLLAERDIVPPVRTTTCHAERLLERFEPGTFDIAYARNSLDHACDPLAAIRNMLGVITREGTVLLRHKAHEAEANKSGRYQGLHQWNFDQWRNHFIIWSKGIERDVTSLLRSEATVSCWREDAWIVCVLSRKMLDPARLGPETRRRNLT
jgi:Methyltransferase domain